MYSISVASHPSLLLLGSSALSRSSCRKGLRQHHSLVKLQPIWDPNRCRKLLGHSSFLLPQRLSIYGKAENDFAISTILKDGSSAMTTIEEDEEDIGILRLDPSLEPFKDHLRYRTGKYADKKKLFEKYEGSLEEFSQGYLKFGFNRQEGGIVYREWAPAAQEAQLIGDFNDWDGSNHKMERNQFGVWTIKIPDSAGNPAIPHNSRVKFRFIHNGTWIDRIPAWIKFATVDPATFAAPYDGVYWEPPSSERYQFKYARPPKPEAPRIYEAHVGMSSSEPRVNSYREFADDVLPRIKSNNYNTVQMMAIMEHSYNGAFGYQVTNFFAVSSRSGTPEDLKYLIDKAHSLGICVLMDVVHSHASNNVTDGLNGFDVGQSSQESYFHTGPRGYHELWDSRVFNYANWEVLRFLLSNLRWWLEEYKFDGFRFDGVTSMLYHHHGINMGFTGNYAEYFSEVTDVDAVVYLMMANYLIHSVLPDATVVAEDVSGMPGLCRPVAEGGVGFDYRLAMAIPDKWIDYLKNKKDDQWSMKEIASSLTNRRCTEKCIAYAESHDQAIVGDKTVAFLLMDQEMYSGMSFLMPCSPIVERGIALHKMIHFITMALGGEGYLNFMGNEFGHPEWIDFPREGNSWSYDKCRRQWTLVDTEHLRYKFMNAFDRAMNALDDSFSFLASTKQIVSSASEEDKVIVFERGDLVFVFNFHPENTYEGYKIGCELPGKYEVALDSDAWEFGGLGRVAHNVDHFTSSEGIPGVPETNFNNRPNSFKVLSPARTCVVYYRVDEDSSEYSKGVRAIEKAVHVNVERESPAGDVVAEQMSTSANLRNRYWILRHGKSIPNEKGLIISSLENGRLAEYGLASEGVSQAQLAGELLLKELKAKNIPLENIRICCSPFSRTMQTAKMAASVLNIPFEGSQCKAMEELRERYFGPTLELLSHEKYPEIWALDEKDPFMPPEGGESAADVASRLATALATIETEFQGCAILVVSHGDTLQILQTILHAVNRNSESSEEDILSRIKGTITKSVLLQHRKFLQTILHAGNRGSESSEEDILSRIKGTITKSVLLQHRKFGLLTGELREIV